MVLPIIRIHPFPESDTSFIRPLRGLDGGDETIEGPVTRPLVTRLTDFLAEAEPKLSDLKNQVQFTQEKVSELMKKYGETFVVENKEEVKPSIVIFDSLSLCIYLYMYMQVCIYEYTCI